MIQAGLKTGKNAYPTVEDVPSDWSDKVKDPAKKNGDKKLSGEKESKGSKEKTSQLDEQKKIPA